MSQEVDPREGTETLQGFALSPQQQRLWLLQQAEPGTVFRSQCAVRIEGALDRTKLAGALARVVAQNEILRTVFRRLPGMSLPLQIVLETAATPFEHVDLAALAAEAREPVAAGLFAAWGRRRFDLERGGVLRVCLVSLSGRDHLLLLGLPALCADPATFGNLVAEIAAAYDGPPAAGEEPPLQYADLSEWQNQLLESADSVEQLEGWRSYWRERDVATRLGSPAPLEQDADRAAAPPFEPASLAVTSEPALAAALARRLTEWNVPAPVFLLACWQVLLWRSTGQSDVLVGVFHDGRRYEELQPALGPLARYLPVDCRLEETMRVRDVLALAHDTLGEAAKRQERFSWPHLDGDATAAPGFFPVCFQAIERPRELVVDGLRLAVRWHDGFADRFKLELACSYAPGDLEVALRYDRLRFRRGTIELLAERLRMLLAGAVAHPDATLRDLELLGSHERRWLSELGAAPANPGRHDAALPLHRGFELQVERAPERVAVVDAEGGLTFGALNLRANRLAHHLRSLGVEVETPVAICLERSAEAVVAILAVLKAGGAWVPLDPGLPPDRLAWMLADVGARVVVTRESWRRVLPGPETRPDLCLLCLDAEAGAIAARAATDLPGGAAAENLAYAIYTSGSTGRPKCVQIEHRSAVNLLIALETAVLEPLGAGFLRASLNAPLAFDASVQQLVLLLAGHTLCVIPEQVRTDGAALLAFLRDQAVDLFDCTPSQLRILLAAGLLDEAAAPRVVLAAGEAIDAAMWSELLRSTRTTFYNVYGPTECTVDSTAHRIERPAAAEPGAPRPVIGRPLANYEVHLLDRSSREVPVGAPGELCVGGRGLARGYLGRPDLTAERFVPDPFASGRRLYRTGDLARYLPDGRLEFLGRIDHQLKLRGYRIEPGEIESALGEHPWVRNAVVVARREAGEGALLVAYVLPSAGAPAGLPGLAAELHGFLRQKLPVYMVPAVFAGLPVFPLTPSGKVDRQALALKPLPERQEGRRSADAVAPRNAVEETLAAIWREVLRLDEVSVEDNFFQLGGDSILSIQVISRASQAGLRLAARQLFEHQTIAGLARVAEVASTTREEAGPVVGPVALTPIQRSFLGQDLPHPEHYNHSLLLIPEGSAGGRLEVAALRRAGEILLIHHDALRMHFAPPDARHPEWRQTNEGPAVELPWAQVDLSALAGASQGPAIEAVAARLQTSFDLARGPLLRMVLFHAGGGQPDRLLLIIHHLVVDGVSWRIVLEDLETVYRQLLRGDAPSLPPKTTALRDWAGRLVDYARSPAAEGQAAYWLERSSRPVPPLPLDHAGGANTVASARAVNAALEADETAWLLQEIPKAYHTQINDVLITALVEAVASWTGSRRLWLELEGHGREEIFPDLDVSRTVGWFTTVFPVLLDLDGILAPGDALKAVKEQLRALPERGFGFGLLRFLGREEISSTLRSLPEGGILFNYLGQLDQAVAEGRLFRGARESTGAGRSPLHPRTHLLEVSGDVSGGRLRITWTYSESRHRRATIEALAQRFMASLRALIAHCRSPEAGGYTPSDFPLAKVDQASLDRWAAAAGGGLEDLYPATPMQQGMLFHTLLVPRSGTHVGQLNVLFRGGFDRTAFERAWSRVIARHATLRTGFAGFDQERPLQLVHARAAVPLQVLDWRGLGADRRRERLAACLEEDLRQDFDLTRPPLMRLTLIREGEADDRLLFTHHHAILDGWSQPILLREFLAGYQAALAGREAALGPVAPYRDYIAWLVRQEPGDTEAYWRRVLAGFADPTPLPGDAGLAGEPSAAPLQSAAMLALPAGLTSALGAWAREHKVTMNTLVQGAWALLLGRSSGRSDVVYGVVSSGRSVPVRGIEDMVGLFINTLPSRVWLRGDLRLPPWLQEIQEQQAELRQYEHSSLAEVQGWSGVAAGLPLFESLVGFENFPVDESVQRATGETLGIADTEVFEQTVYPLGLSATPGPRLALTLRHDSRRFSTATVWRLLHRLESVLEGMLVHGDRPLEALALLTRVERHQILTEWNDTRRALAGEECLPERIEAWGEELRDTVAVVCGTSQLSYGELASRARCWGAWLRGHGVRQESVVGVSMERSPALIEALLGVWQAQALFVVLDPALPLERRRFMAEDAGVELVLTDRAGGEALPRPTFAVEEVALPTDPGPGWNGERLPETGAYVIYTSGSTGRPKGVLVPHAGLHDLLASQRELLGVGPGSRILQWAAWSFDAALADLVMALGAGGTLVLAKGRPLVGPELVDLLAREAVSHCTVTPSALSAAPAADLPALATLVVAGEAFPAELAERWSAGRRLLNNYGPTEATIWATAQRVTAAGRPPIGRPIGNARVYVVDAAGTPVPPGADGELWLGGAGIARGYLRRQDLTAERFVPDPFGEPGDRLYRTGDLARFLPGGALEFLGRIDSQVKIRGVRVEPGEVEAALAAHPGIREAVAVAQTEPTGDKRLVAFVVAAERAYGLVEELRASLQATLPEPMVPSHFVLLDRLPLSPSGKVDRKGLEEWELLRDGAARGLAASSEALPRTPVEELVAGLFAEVLQRARIGIDEDFFAAGGHSLTAMRVVSRARILFGVELPLGALFDSPTVALFAARVEELRAESRGPVAPPIVPVPPGQERPLSFAQERLWFLDQLDPGMATYNLPTALGLRGPLQRPLLDATLSRLIGRHEALRTRFESSGGRPVQVIDPPAATAAPLVDLTGVPAGRREALARALAVEEAGRPFDLSRGPLLRLTLLRLGPQHHVVLLTAHHIVADGWSLGIFIRELGEIYSALSQGRRPELPALPIQYADYAVWQRAWLSGGVLAGQLDFWREHLAGAPALVTLPLDRARPPMQSFRGAREPFLVGEALARRVEGLGRKQGATLFMTYLAAFYALLARLTGQEDHVVGTPFANRSRLETQGLIGCFINTLALRARPAGDKSFTGLLAEVREATLAAYASQDLPFEMLVDDLAPERSLAHSPLFQVMFDLQNAPDGELELPGLQLEAFSSGALGEKFDLTLSCVEARGGMAGRLGYNPDLFDRTTARRMAGYFVTLVAEAAERTEDRLADLALLSAAERHQIVIEWSHRAGLAEGPQWVHEQLAAQAARTPDAVALVFEREVLQLGELDRRAERVARSLRRLGVGAESRVGLCVDRSPRMVVGLLGILKSGGAFVPLDPAHPPARLAYMIADAGVRVVLTEEHLRGILPEVETLCLDTDPGTALPEEEGGAPPLHRTRGEDLAYVIYTSGSTGRPKGVMVEHASLASVLAASRQAFGWAAGDAMACAAPFAFDIFLFELLSPLLAGGRCRLLPAGSSLDVEGWADLLPELTRVHAVPALMRQLVAAARHRNRRYPRLRSLFVGGDRVPLELLAEMREVFPEAAIHVLYGPTEATIIATSWTIPPGAVPGRTSIGGPLPDVELLVLDARGHAVPIGVAGEIWIGGPGVTRGYLERPELTAERYPLRQGRRFYRTGDLARWRADATLEFLGRADQQVKLRGFRIELGEIEAALLDRPEVREAAVVLREEASGERRLVAYVVPSGSELEVEGLRAALRQTLPEHMLPAAFVALRELPLTRHGKVDHQALPAPERPPRGEGGEAPRTEVEQLLARIWCDVLGLQQVGARDNFFELGGDSILSIQVVSRATQAGYRLTPRQLFEHQTIAELAAVAGSAQAVDAEQGAVTGRVLLTPIQRRFFASEPVDPQHFNLPVLLAVKEDGLSPGVVEQALAALVDHHDALRTRFAAGPGGWEQWVEAPGGEVPWSRLDLRGLTPPRILEALAELGAQAQQSLDLTRGPLVRGLWVDPPEGAPRLLLVVHHLVTDGVSWRILLDDLERACRQLTQGARVELPAKTTSFQQWAERLSEYAARRDWQEELRLWRTEILSGTARLPVDGGRQGNVESSLRHASISLDTEETGALLREAGGAYRMQAQEILLTALGRALGEVQVDLEGHGRAEDLFAGVDLTRTVGWLTAIYPVRLAVSGLEEGEALRTVKERLRSVPDGGMGYGLLHDLLGEELAAAGRSEVSFNYLGQLDQVLVEGSWFRGAGEPVGPPRSPRAQRPYLLDVTVVVAGGRLRIDWSYSGNVHRRETVEGWAKRYLAELRALIAHCREVVARREGRYTLSDFPLAGLGAGELERILGREWGIEDLYPLSPLQEGMLFHSLYEPGSGVYVEQVLSRLSGELDVEAFEGAWRRVVQATPVLRTSFRWRDLARPLQVVHGEAVVEVERQDWQGLSPERQAALLESLLRTDRERGFDLMRAPMMRWILVRTGPREHWFLWTQHHILLDGWSSSALIAELLACYEALHAGEEPRLQRRRPYRDYIAWLGRQDLAQTEELWRRTLAGWREPEPLTEVREIDRTRYGSERRWLQCTPEQTLGLQQLARQQRLTLSTLIQGAWGLLLSRYSNQPDVVFGATVSGRPADLPGVESILGLFINTLPVRLRVAGPTLLLPWLEELQRQQLEMRQHEHTPLVKVQEWAEIPRGVPLFDSILVVESYPRAAAMKSAGEGSFHVSEVRVQEQTNYPLTVSAVPGEQLLLALEYARSHFDGATVERMLGHFRNLLLGMVRPEGAQRLSDLPLLSPAQRHQLTAEWNDAARRFDETGSALAAFERQAARTPDAIAVSSAGLLLSYGELDLRAEHLARRLRHAGVVPGDVVGLCAQRSPEMLAGLLGIWKAGGAYLPLDPAYPAARLAFMLEDSRVPVLLSESGLEAVLPQPGTTPLRRVMLDRQEEVAGGPAAASRHGGAGDLAYVIYTSGSTGRPKGVVIPHRALENFLCSMADEPGLSPADILLAVTSLSFDIAALELFLPLRIGARLELVPSDVSADGPRLLARLRDSGATVVQATPSTWRLLLEAGLAPPTGLRLALVGGEALPADLAARLAPLAGQAWNVYGPTETTVWSTSCRFAGGEARVPIGRPLANTVVRVLDPGLRPVPVGVAGELYLGGLGLAVGYLSRPELTAERFLPDPCAAEAGARLYRTGDLVRFLADGRLEFLRRADHQVKVRGFRIEPGEIESVLGLHPSVERVAVVVWQERGDQRLVAYLVARPGASPALPALREWLRSRLPEHMVPAHFVRLDALPLTPNGKLDRRSLTERRPVASGDGGGGGAASPRTPVEELLAGFFAEVLHAERVGVEESFFDLGGHSLLAMQIASRVQQAFGIDLPLQALFEGPTVAALALRVEALRRQPGEGAVPAIVPVVPRPDDLPLSFAQERLWFLEQLDPGTSTYNLPMALGLRGSLEPGALRRSLSELVRRHEVLRTRYVIVEGRPAQVIDAAGEMALPLIDLQGLAAEVRAREARRLLRQEGGRPFDLSREPSLRAGLLRLEPERHAVWLTIHHIAADGWSTGILVRELSALYGAALRGERADLPELAAQYADFALWQREWLAGDELARQLRFWRQSLAGAPPLLELPLDRPRPAVQSFRGARSSFQLPRELARDLVALSRSQGATTFMVLLAVLSALLARMAAQEDLVVGTVVANRNRREIEDLIGFFVNTLALRVKAPGDLPFSGLIREAREIALGSYAHQDLPFEKLVEELAPERSRAHSPLFQVLFVLQNAPQATLELPGITLEPVAGEPAGAARFDLTLTAVEGDGGMLGTWEYNRDLFDAATIARLSDHLLSLLQGALRQPERQLADLPLLSAGQCHQLLREWDDAAATGRPAAGILEQIAQHARTTPEALAATFGGERLTYAELDERAERLARRLREQGVGPEVCVGLCLERSFDLLIGVLAILKAGGAYLPLDPAYPIDRLAFMLEDAFAGSALRLVLIEEGAVHDALAARVPGLRRAGGGDLPAPRGTAPAGAAADDLAYVIYTSGSTGRPKGVAVTHRGLASLAAAQRRLFAVEQESRVLQFSSPSFDASVSEIVVTLTAGACLCLADRAAMMPGPDLANLLDELGVTVVTLPPSALAALPERPYAALRTLVVAGEACPPDLAWRWARGRRVVNAYGPTEMTVCASAGVVREGEALSIGRAIDDTRLHVLDPRMSPVPIGAAGELYLTGPGLARGYHGRPEATAEAFVPDPFTAQPGSRLYRTGDRVRRLPDGRVEFLGRRDRQVKLRGFRIELGEIEAALARHPAVAEVAVVVREERTGDRRLAAHVVARMPREAELAPAELRTFLRALLPEHMIPALFVVRERLPLLPNGKVDLRALARERGPEAAGKPGGVLPRNPWEAALAEVFAEVLGLESVGVEDDFFDLGGHSLLAVGLAARVDKRFGRKLPLATLFEGPTVEQVALRLFASSRSAAWSPVVAMNPEGSKPPLFCVHPIGGGVTGYFRHLVQHLGADQPFYGLQARGLEEHAGLPHPSIEEMAREYVDAVQSVQPHGPYLLAGASYGGWIAFEMAQQLARKRERVALLALFDTGAPKSLAKDGPPTEEEELPDPAIQSYGMAQAMAAIAGKELRLSLDELQGLAVEKVLELVLERMREAGLTDETIDLPWVLRYRQSFNDRIRAGARYRARPYVGGRIVLFRTRPAAVEPPSVVPDLRAGWKELALTGGVEARWVPGSHETMFLEPHVAQLAASLAACIEEASRIFARHGRPEHRRAAPEPAAANFRRRSTKP